MNFRRVYLFEEDFRRLRLAKARYKQDMSKLANEAIASLFDDKGQRKKVVLNDEALQPLLEWANDLRISPEELINMLIGTVRTLFDPNLSLAGALRSIPALAKDLGVYKAGKKSD